MSAARLRLLHPARVHSSRNSLASLLRHRHNYSTSAAAAKAEQEVLEPKDKLHGSYHWTAERGVSVALIPFIAAPFVVGPGNAMVDAALGILLPVHVHIGMGSVIIDYFHPRKYGAMGHVITWLMRGFTAVAFYGMWKINTEDVGISEFVKRVWTGKVGVLNNAIQGVAEEKKV